MCAVFGVLLAHTERVWRGELDVSSKTQRELGLDEKASECTEQGFPWCGEPPGALG